jgi:hypothetical protein
MIEQGSLELLDEPVAQRLLTSTEYARIAYTALDGTPRLVPMLFHWNGSEIVLPGFATAAKLRALRVNPAVAITIDTAGPPPEVLQLRGTAEVQVEPGMVEEYALAHKRYYGEEQGARNVEQVGDASMARIVLRPSWVGVIDFQQYVPKAMTEALAGGSS